MSDLSPPDELLDTLYDATTNFDKWQDFLAGVAVHFDAEASLIEVGDPVDKRFSFYSLYGMDQHLFPNYTKYIDQDPRTPLILDHYKEKPVSCRLVLDEADWHASPMYQNIFVPIGMDYSMVAAFDIEPPEITAFGVLRSPDNRYFDQNECDRFSEFIPHIKRAVKLQKQFAQIEEERFTALSVLDDLPMGIIVSDMQSRILFSNRLAKDLTSSRDGIIIRHGELWANDQQNSVEFRDLIRTCVESSLDGNVPNSHSIALPRKESSRPLYVRVTPVWKNNAPFQVKNLNRPMAAIYITDPDLPQETETALLQRMFGLTPKEAETLKNLVTGFSVEETAREMDISVSTVRTYLKSLFNKTETSSQQELIKLVVTSPVWTSHNSV